MYADDLADAAHAGAVALDAADTAADVANAANKAENASDVGRAAETCLNSFSADTPVATPDGEIAISAIVTGTVVLAYDEATGTTGAYAVTATIHHTDPAIVLLTVGGETLETTPKHPFSTRERGWVDAIDLRMGEHVPRLDGPDGVVQARSVVPRVQPMYNLTVATAHTFFVGDGQWLVHNTGCGSIAEADALANTADSALRQLRKVDLADATVAAGRADGKVTLSVYHADSAQATADAVDHLRGKGWNVLDAPTERGPRFHAERQLDDAGFNSIGISNQGGMCNSCRTHFATKPDTVVRRYKE